MKKSTRSFLLLSLTGCMFSSCVYITQSVPDMPYEGSAGRTRPRLIRERERVMYNSCLARVTAT